MFDKRLEKKSIKNAIQKSFFLSSLMKSKMNTDIFQAFFNGECNLVLVTKLKDMLSWLSAWNTC